MKNPMMYLSAFVLAACGGSGHYLTPYNDDAQVFERIGRGAVKAGCTREKGGALDYFRCKDDVVVNVVGTGSRKFVRCKGLSDSECRALTERFYAEGAE